MSVGRFQVKVTRAQISTCGMAKNFSLPAWWGFPHFPVYRRADLRGHVTWLQGWCYGIRSHCTDIICLMTFNGMGRMSGMAPVYRLWHHMGIGMAWCIRYGTVRQCNKGTTVKCVYLFSTDPIPLFPSLQHRLELEIAFWCPPVSPSHHNDALLVNASCNYQVAHKGLAIGMLLCMHWAWDGPSRLAWSDRIIVILKCTFNLARKNIIKKIVTELSSGTWGLGSWFYTLWILSTVKRTCANYGSVQCVWIGDGNMSLCQQPSIYRCLSLKALLLSNSLFQNGTTSLP